MWTPVQKLLKTTQGSTSPSEPVVVPLRKSGPNFSDIIEGSLIVFSDSCPLTQLCGQTARVEKIRNYQYGEDNFTTFRLGLRQKGTFSFSVAEDDQGQYLAISRLLSSAEQDQWFGADALSFFTEASTAKTIRCKANGAESDWTADRYVKSVDWVEGVVGEGKLQLSFRYNLLVNDTGEKALEIEHYPTLKKNQIYLTVYRPIEDIERISEPSEVQPPPNVSPRTNGAYSEPVMLDEPVPETKPKPDFRRASVQPPEAEIHITPTIPKAPVAPTQKETTPPLPSFLLSREHNYLSLDAVIAPDPERVRCGLLTAKSLIDTALQRGVRVRDVMRNLIGLDSMLSEEVILELPLSDADYRQLAMRYKMRPDHRDQIRAKIQQELRIKLLGVAE